MVEEKWMVARAGRATMARLERMAQEPANPRSNSTVAAGWICCVLGLFSAWILPPAHAFFAAAFILAIVAMSTHQVRQGTVLLIASVVGPVICVLVSFAVVTVAGRALLLKAHDQFASAAQLSRNSNAALLPPAMAGVPGVAAPLPTAENPLTVRDLGLMLRSGFGDDEVIAASGSKQLIDRVDDSQARYLRSLGAGNKLISYLQGRQLFATPLRASATFQSMPATNTASIQSSNVYSNSPASQTYYPPANDVMDARQKDARIQELKSQIDELDDQTRRVRNNPKGELSWYYYYGSPTGVNLERLDSYLKSLDKRRNDLRREKWRLEGR